MSDLQVNGLKTPALEENNFPDGATESSKIDGPKKSSALQVAQSLEAKIHEIAASLEKDEGVMAARLAKMSDSIDELLEKVKS